MTTVTCRSEVEIRTVVQQHSESCCPPAATFLISIPAGALFPDRRGRHTLRSSGFPNYVLRLLVVPQTDERRVPQTLIRRPLCELDFCDRRRLQPDALLHLLLRDSLAPRTRTFVR